MKPLMSKELRQLNQDQLNHKINEMRKKFLELRLGAVTKHVANFASVKRSLRKSIARALTVQREQL